MKEKLKLSLQPSEAIVVTAAATIYAAYIVAGQVAKGEEAKWRDRSIQEALEIAHSTDNLAQSDNELG